MTVASAQECLGRIAPPCGLGCSVLVHPGHEQITDGTNAHTKRSIRIAGPSPEPKPKGYHGLRDLDGVAVMKGDPDTIG